MEKISAPRYGKVIVSLGRAGAKYAKRSNVPSRYFHIFAMLDMVKYEQVM
tara:strand:- start:1784 stop:1933 length:150 start_codon:yes stop_codon:yes gene_type:complete